MVSEGYGHIGRIVTVDLSSGKLSSERTSKYASTVLGGRGINARILFHETIASTKPLSPENPLIFGTGPLVGTTCPSSGRVTITAKSPVTGLYGESNVGGEWGPELKFAGYDHLVVRGASEKPVYLLINDESVEIRDARQVWGLDTSKTREFLVESVGDPEAKVICIGLGGENMVSFACVRHQLKHTAGRTGMGAVMGSKRLKAVVVRGTRGVRVARPDELLKESEDIVARIKAHPNYQRWIRLGEGGCGITGLTDAFTDSDVTVGGNFQTLVLQKWPRHGNEKLCVEYGVRMTGCYDCPIRCFPFVSVPGVGASEFGCEPQLSFTFRLLNPDPKLGFELSNLANQLGIDAASTSSVISFAIDMYDKGVINREDTDGMDLKWGDRDTLIMLMAKIARREGFGDLLAEGVMKAAHKIGKGAEYYAHHVKGLEITNQDPRVMPGRALGYAVGSRGDVTRGTVPTEYLDINLGLDERTRREALAAAKSQYGTDKVGYHMEYEGKEKVLIKYENQIAIFDILGLCKNLGGYGFDFIEEDQCARLYSLVIGQDTPVERLVKAAEATITLERAFNARSGATRADDQMPERFFKEPVADSRHKGAVLDLNKFERLKDQYYNARGWDVSTGKPSAARLKELGLEDISLT